MAKSEVKWIRLGEFLENHEVPCGNPNAVVSGVNINKEFIRSRANLSGTDVSKYTAVKPRYFAANLMHIGRDERIPVAYNNTDEDIVVTSAYSVFRVKESKHNEILDNYIFLFFNSKEIDRLTWFYTDSSVRGNLRESRLYDILIPVPYTDGKPDLEKQQVAVDAWQGLRKMKEDNEQLVEPLMQLCRSYMESVKKKYNPTHIGPFIEEVDERNTDLSIKLSQGINNKKYFQTPVQVAEDSKSDKIVRKGYFAYNRATTRNSDKISIAYRDGEDCTVSSSYQVFRIIDENIINPYFLLLWFKRPEFDRYARFKSRGSAHEFFNFDEMQAVRVPLPDIEMQRAIADIYLCAERAKHIAEEADRLSREICPALMQHIIHEN